MQEAENVTSVLQDSMEGLWEVVITQLPSIAMAFLVLILGLLIAPILGNIAKRFVRLTKIDSFAERAGFIEEVKNIGISMSISGLVGGLVKWFFLIAFIIASVEILEWGRLTDVLYELLFFIPNVIVAVVILTLGLVLAGFAEKAVMKKLEISKAPVAHGQMIAKSAKWAIMVFTSLTAVHQLGIAQELIVILFAGIILTLSLAFGLGGREKAAEIIEKIDKSK